MSASRAVREDIGLETVHIRKSMEGMEDTKEVEKEVEEEVDQEMDLVTNREIWIEEKVDASSVERRVTKLLSVPTKMRTEGATDMTEVVEMITEKTEDADVIQDQAVTMLKQDTEEEDEETAETVATEAEDLEEDEAEIGVTQDSGEEEETGEVQEEDLILMIAARTNTIRMETDRERDNPDPNQGEKMVPLAHQANQDQVEDKEKTEKE